MSTLDEPDRQRFDRLVDDVVGALPEAVLAVLERVALVIEDEPTQAMLEGLVLDLGSGQEPGDVLCGLHVGVADTETSVEISGEPPSVVYVFRRGVLELVGGWNSGEDAVREEIRVTVLHEIGHQFGLDEDDLADLGYD